MQSYHIDFIRFTGDPGRIRTCDPQLRRLDEGTNNRIEERETEYPNISYQLALRVNEFDVDPTLTDAQLAAFTAGVLDYPLLPHVVAEINFARFVRGRFIALQAARDDLAQQLEGYLQSIR